MLGSAVAGLQCLSNASSSCRVGTLVYPSFVEFDMSAEGFGCLFLPSIAPQSASGGSVVGSALSSTEPNVIGGIGTGEGHIATCCSYPK